MALMKRCAVKYSIQNTIDKGKAVVVRRHDKKFANVMNEKLELEGTANNPNQAIWNFSR